MIEKVIRTIKKYNMINMNDKIIVGVSGGPDSVALLHALDNLREKYNLELIAVHINHNLRGSESDGDEGYVKRICSLWGIPLFAERVDIEQIAKDKKISIEVAGRDFRYDLFERISKENGAQKIAVAHNENDNAETILMRIIRGTGIEGLTGIKPVRDNIIRPLIEINREEIEEYCNFNGLEPRIDSSNLQNIYTRNKIRLDLIPYLKNEFNPNIVKTLSRMSTLIENENLFIDTEAKKVFVDVVFKKTKEYISIDLDKINKQNFLVISRVIRLCIKELVGNLVDFEQKNANDVIDFIHNSKTGSIFDLPKGLKLKKDYNVLHIINNYQQDAKTTFEYVINVNSEVYISETGYKLKLGIKNIEEANDIKVDNFTQKFDADKMGNNLVIRTRNNGDIFSPLGMNGKKKLKDYFIDEKIPRNERDNIPLIANNNEIIWIIGKRISNNFKVDNKTRTVMIMSYQKAE